MAGLTLPNLSPFKVVLTDADKMLVSGTNTDAELSAAVTASHAAVTLGTANGLSLTGQELSLPVTASSQFAALAVQVSGDLFPGLSFERINGVAKTNRKWAFIVGSDGNWYLQDGTAGVNPFCVAKAAPDNELILGVATATLTNTGTLGSAYQLDITNGSKHLKWGVNSTAAECQTTGGIPLYLNYSGNDIYCFTNFAATLRVNGTIRADTTFNLNGTDGVTQAASAGTVVDSTAVAGGIVTGKTQVTYIADGAHSLVGITSITTANGRITAMA